MQNLFDTAECQESANRATAVRSLNHVNARMPARGAHADPPAHAVRRTDPARRPRADPPAAKGLRIQKDLQRAIPLRALCPDPRTAPGPHKDKKGAGPARDADQTAPPDNAPRRGEARKGRPPCGACSPHDAGRGRMRRNADRPARDAATSPEMQRGPQGATSPGGPLPARAMRAAGAAMPPRARNEKRPPRARRPALPQPCAAVLSAKAGLTAGFGMGPGDPRLCGRARGGRSPAALSYSSLPGTPSGATLAAAWRARKKMAHRARCFIEDAKSSGY